MAFAPRVEIKVQVVAGQLAVDQLHTPDFDDPIPLVGVQAGGFRIQEQLAHGSVVFFGMVDRVARYLDHDVLLCQVGLAAQT